MKDVSKNLILYVIFLTCLPNSSFECQDKFFHGKRFNGTSFQIIRKSRLFPCAADCVAFSLCKSISFHRKKMMCFLHLQDDAGQVITDPDFSYSPIQDWDSIVLGPCQDHSCNQHQKCVVQRKQRRCTDKRNLLSHGKKTKAIDTVYAMPFNAVDGNKSPDWLDHSCFHVSEPGGWWQVDLGVEALITDVLIVNRVHPCCDKNFRNFDLETFTEDPSVDPTAEARLCYRHPDVALAAGAAVTFNCTTPVVGRYFRVAIPNPLESENKVQLCEVEVYGWPIE